MGRFRFRLSTSFLSFALVAALLAWRQDHVRLNQQAIDRTVELYLLHAKSHVGPSAGDHPSWEHLLDVDRILRMNDVGDRDAMIDLARRGDFDFVIESPETMADLLEGSPD